MSDWTVEELAERYKAGRLSRRRFVSRMAGVGLTAPVIAAVLQACGGGKKESGGAASKAELKTPTAPAEAGATKASPTAAAFTPTKRGGGGTVKLLYWQAPVLLNAHLSSGDKDYSASRLFTEPLATFDPDGEMVPVLAAEIPSIEKGTVDKDGKSVTWKLKKDVTWHDGKPFTAEDVVFTYDYVTDKTTAATSSGAYANIESVQAVDQYTVKVNFKEPSPFWAVAFTSSYGHILPKHLFSQYKGAEARNAPQNLKPVGTGPYKFVDFKPGDITLAEINPNYHVPNRPFFDRVEMKGGGDALSAARSVLQTEEYDFAWNMQVAADVLANLEKEGKGYVDNAAGASTEAIHFNFSDPYTEVEGEKGSIKSKHPFLSDPKVRQAFTLAVNRKLIVDQLYGPTGNIAEYYLWNPKKYIPGPSKWEYNLQKAAQLLDEAGWKKGSDGARAKDGKKMKVLYQTSQNPVRQNTQAIIKKDLESLGIEVELKAIIADVYFGASTEPDSWPQFNADLQMFTNGPSAPDPQNFLKDFTSAAVAQKANKWSGRNDWRYQNPAYDALWEQSAKELDPVKRADLIKKMNQLIIDDLVLIPVVNRNVVSAVKKNLKGLRITTWDQNTWDIAYWYRQT